MKSLRLLFTAIVALWAVSLPARAETNIVASIVRAPVVADGDVAGAVTDLVINLDTTLDPAVPGRTLLAGRTIKVTLPKEFVNTGALPFQDVFSSPTCVPGNLQCSTAVLLQGWPQYPLLPRVPPAPPGSGTPQYLLSLEGVSTIVFTARVDLVPGAALSGPGIKQIHLLLNGFTNPARPGLYPITVEAETGPGGALERGTGLVYIRPQIKPSINITSAFNRGAPNTIYQQAAPGALTPLPYDLLLWDSDGAPMEGVTIETVNANHALLRQGERVVGHIAIETPPGATGHAVFAQAPSVLVKAPITGVPTARLTAYLRLGSAGGSYVVTFALSGGNAVEVFVKVE